MCYIYTFSYVSSLDIRANCPRGGLPLCNLRGLVELAELLDDCRLLFAVQFAKICEGISCSIDHRIHCIESIAWTFISI